MLQRLALVKPSGVGSHLNFEHKSNVLQNNKILSEAKKVVSCTSNSSVIYELAKIIPNSSNHVWVQHMITNVFRLILPILYHGNEILNTSPSQKLIKICISTYRSFATRVSQLKI
jgi:hypothetical protein